MATDPRRPIVGRPPVVDLVKRYLDLRTPEERSAFADESYDRHRIPQSREERTARRDAAEGGLFMRQANVNRAEAARERTRATLPLAENVEGPERQAPIHLGSEPFDIRRQNPLSQAIAARALATAQARTDAESGAETTRRARRAGRAMGLREAIPPTPPPPVPPSPIAVGAEAVVPGTGWIADTVIPNLVQGMAGGGHATLRTLGDVQEGMLPSTTTESMLDTPGQPLADLRRFSRESGLGGAVTRLRDYLGMSDPDLAIQASQIRELGGGLAEEGGIPAVASQLAGRLGYEMSQAGLAGGAVQPAQGAGFAQRLATRGLGLPIDMFAEAQQDESTAQAIADVTGSETAQRVASSLPGRLAVGGATGLGLGTLLEEGILAARSRAAAQRALREAEETASAPSLAPRIDLSEPRLTEDVRALPLGNERVGPNDARRRLLYGMAQGADRLPTPPVRPAPEVPQPVRREDLPFTIRPGREEPVQPPAPERPRAAAVEVQGRVFSGAHHADALEEARRAGAHVPGDPWRSGFVTDQNRFVTTEEAADLARAAGDARVRADTQQMDSSGLGPSRYDLEPQEEPRVMGRAMAGDSVGSQLRTRAEGEQGNPVAAERYTQVVPPPTSLAPVIRGEAPPPVGGKKKSTVEEVALALSDLWRRANPRKRPGWQNVQPSEPARAIYHETLAALGADGNAIGWYDRKLAAAMRHLEELHPELATDPDAGTVFRIMLAVTSNGQDVRSNFRNANELYEVWKQNPGRLPTEFSFGGKSRAAMVGSFEDINEMLDSGMTIGQIREFLMSEMTVRDLAARGFEIGGEQASHRVLGAMMFGPKIGSFFANLNGHFDSITMDLWFTRTMRRHAGDTRSTNVMGTVKWASQALAELEAGALELDGVNARKLMTELRRLASLTERAADRLTDPRSFRSAFPTVSYWAKGRHRAYARTSVNPATGKAASYWDKTRSNQIAKNLDQAISEGADAPDGAGHRAWMRGVIADVQRMLRDDGIEMSNADLQAVLWYFEKDAYARMGVGNIRAESADYEIAARELLQNGRGSAGAGGRGPAEGAGGVRPGESAAPVGEALPAPRGPRLQSGGVVGGALVGGFADAQEGDDSWLDGALAGALAGAGVDIAPGVLKRVRAALQTAAQNQPTSALASTIAPPTRTVDVPLDTGGGAGATPPPRAPSGPAEPPPPPPPSPPAGEGGTGAFGGKGQGSAVDTPAVRTTASAYETAVREGKVGEAYLRGGQEEPLLNPSLIDSDPTGSTLWAREQQAMLDAGVKKRRVSDEDVKRMVAAVDVPDLVRSKALSMDTVQLAALGSAIKTSRERLVELAQAINKATDPEELAKLKEAEDITFRALVALDERLTEAGSEQGRGLRILAQVAATSNTPDFSLRAARRAIGVDQLPKDVEDEILRIWRDGQRHTGPGAKDAKSQANRQLSRQTQLEMARYLTRLQKPTASEFWFGTRRAGMLSHTITHLVNTLSGMTVSAIEAGVVHPVAAALDRTLAALGKRERSRTISMQIVAARVRGMKEGALKVLGADEFSRARQAAAQGGQGLLRQLRAGGEASMRQFLSGIDPDNPMDSLNRRRLNYLRALPDEMQQGGGGLRGKVNRTAARILQAGYDTVFAMMSLPDQILFHGGLQASLRERAELRILNQGLKRSDPQFEVEVQKVMADPHPEDAMAAQIDALYETFKAQGATSTKVQQFGESIGGQFLTPFTLTPVNLLLMQLDYTPGVGAIRQRFVRAGMDPEARAQIRGDRELLNSLARQGAGAALIGYGMYLAAHQRLATPYSPGEKPADRRSRELRDIPNASIKVGGEWHTIQQLGPPAMMIMLGGQLYNALSDPEIAGDWAAQASAAGMTAATSAVGQVTQMPLAQSLADLTRMVDEAKAGDRRGAAAAWLGRSAASFTPMGAAVAGSARALDSVRDRKADSFSSAVSERLPGLRQTVAPRVDPLGRTSTPEPVPEQYANPLRSRGERTDPVTRVLADHNVTPDALDRVPGETAVERAQAQRQLGRVVERVVTQVTGSAPVTDNEKLEELRQDWANAERIARDEEETPGYIRSEILRAALTESRKIWRATPEGKARRRAERANRARRQDLEQQRLEQRRRSRD
jgi:hypothetical protein